MMFTIALSCLNIRRRVQIALKAPPDALLPEFVVTTAEMSSQQVPGVLAER
jgi:hypothetical protein